MAKITISEIQAELQKDNWKLISTEYQNLDTILTYECNEGHRVYAPWKKIRIRRECPLCAQNVHKEQDTKIPKKSSSEKRILALDQATYTTGFSIYDGSKLIRYGVFTTSAQTEEARNAAVEEWLLSMIMNWSPDIIGLEDIQLQPIGAKEVKSADNIVGIQTYKTLAHLQGVLMNAAYNKKIPFEICPTPTWRAHCGVAGRTRADKKKSMQLLVKKWFDISVTEDEADAIGIGKYISEKLCQKYKIENWE